MADRSFKIEMHKAEPSAYTSLFPNDMEDDPFDPGTMMRIFLAKIDKEDPSGDWYWFFAEDYEGEGSGPAGSKKGNASQGVFIFGGSVYYAEPSEDGPFRTKAEAVKAAERNLREIKSTLRARRAPRRRKARGTRRGC